jgi:GTP-binding protein HflX
MWGEIGPIPVITALNKCDMVSEEEREERAEAISHLAPNPIFISARTGEGLDELRATIGRYLPKWVSADVTLPRSEEGISALSWLYQVAIVRNVDYDACEMNGPCIKAKVDARESVLNQLDKRMEHHA